MPGQESVRDSAHPLDNRAKGSLYLAELCHAISKHKEIHISNHTFVPQEFITQHLERLLLTNLSLYAHSSDYSETCPRRPSEVLSFLHAELNNLQILDSFSLFKVK
jgi:hypothetical protein